MIGWIIAAGVVGFAVGSSNSKQEDGVIPQAHKRCRCCGSHNVEVYGIRKDGSFAKVGFSCNKCRNSWAKTYHLT